MVIICRDCHEPREIDSLADIKDGFIQCEKCGRSLNLTLMMAFNEAVKRQRPKITCKNGGIENIQKYDCGVV